MDCSMIGIAYEVVYFPMDKPMYKGKKKKSIFYITWRDTNFAPLRPLIVYKVLVSESWHLKWIQTWEARVRLKAAASTPDSLLHTDWHSMCQFATFFFSHSLIRADSAPKPAEIGRNPPKLAKKLAETHVKKNKNKLELISYLVFNLLYTCQIICRLNNSN